MGSQHQQHQHHNTNMLWDEEGTVVYISNLGQNCVNIEWALDQRPLFLLIKWTLLRFSQIPLIFVANSLLRLIHGVLIF